MFGTRSARFIMKSLPLLGGALVVGGGLGFGIAHLLPSHFSTSATIELGLRPVHEPLENPIVAVQRLRAAAYRRAERVDESALVDITNRLDAQNVPTRYIELSVRARTASGAESIMDAAIASLLAEDQTMYAYERSVADAELEGYRREAERL